MVPALNIKILDIEDGGILVSEISALSDLKSFAFPMVIELDIDAFDRHELKLLPILSNRERQKYITYLRWKDARRYILSRAALRLVLANFCNIPVNRLEFGESADKKPFLIQTGESRIEFNISHTDKKIVIAVDRSAIGVDIESTENAAKPGLIGPRVLSSEEQYSVANSKDARRAFCLYWTRKEAFLKAIGKGIDDDIVKVPALEGDYKYWQHNGLGLSNWTVASLNSGDQHIFSLAYQSEDKGLKPNFIRLDSSAILQSVY